MNSSEKQEIIQSLLYEKFKEKSGDMGLNLDDAARQVFGKSYSSLYRYCLPENPLKAIHIKKFAKFLNVSNEKVIALHQNKEFISEKQLEEKSNVVIEDEQKCREVSSDLIIENEHQENNNNYKTYMLTSILFLLTVVIFLSALLIKSGHTNQPKSSNHKLYTSKFEGYGTDINLTKTVVFDDFHSKLYTYKFKNGVTKIKGDEITIHCDVETINNANPEQKYTGSFEASGHYLNGNAAVSYEIKVGDEFEKWVGVMMIKMPSIGDYKGYWLTIHTDLDDKGTGIFAFGDANLKRTSAINDI